MPSKQTWRIAVDGGETTAVPEQPSAGATGAVFVCAHGAGGHMDDRPVVAVCDALRARGVATVRFNFLYRARGSRRPDPMPRLLECLDAVVARVRAELDPPVLALGGRSMGGRAASVLVANGAPCEGLLLLAYPLHPPGHPEKLRAAHLASIGAPVLCFNGTRDPFCERPLMERTLSGLGANWRMRWIEGADHGFHVLKRTGRTDAEVVNETADEAARWIGSLPSGTRR